MGRRIEARRFSRRQAEVKMTESAAQAFREVGREDVAEEVEAESRRIRERLAEDVALDVFGGNPGRERRS